MKTVLLAPLDPVHDVGLKMIRRALENAGHKTILLQPDLAPEEIVESALENQVDCVLLGRTLGYGTAEAAARFVDLADASGLRDRVLLGIGGMAIRPELAAELGFDGGFGPGTTPEEAVAFVEGRTYKTQVRRVLRQRADFWSSFTYEYRHREIGRLLDKIARDFLVWAEGKSSPAVERAAVRREILRQGPSATLTGRYARLCNGPAAEFYRTGTLPPKVRELAGEELQAISEYAAQSEAAALGQTLRHTRSKPYVFAQYGTGCLSMDVAHIKICEAWGADGVVHFDPSWGARTEGLIDGYFSQEGDGTVITWQNLAKIKSSLSPATIWQVRAHRGLNTPETVLLAGEAGAHMTKINIAYGSLGGGTDPARLGVDGLAAMRYAAEYGLAYDIVTNEELCGVPAYKALAGMLIGLQIGRVLGGRPVMQPLFCYSPEAMIHGLMADNYVDYNLAKIMTLRSIIDAPIWPGAPIGFMTHTEDRVQSSLTTALHAVLASSLEVEAISIASSDEAYSGGPIISGSRVDTLRAVKDAFRFFGQTSVKPTEAAQILTGELTRKIETTLRMVAEIGFIESLYRGFLGSPEDGAYPGRNGRDTIWQSESLI